MQHVFPSQLLHALHRSTTVRLIPLPIHNRHMRIHPRLIRPPKLKIKPRRLILNTLRIMQHLDQKRQIVIRHQPPRTLLRTVHPQHSRIPIATIYSIRVGRPHARAGGGYLAKETEFAFEEEFCEGGARMRCAVEVCEAEGV